MHGEYDNVLLWCAVSKEAAAALNHIQSQGIAHWEPGNWMSYMVDGCTLRLPMVKRAQNYKTTHWLPVYWRPGPIPEALMQEVEAAKAKRQRAKHARA